MRVFDRFREVLGSEYRVAQSFTRDANGRSIPTGMLTQYICLAGRVIPTYDASLFGTKVVDLPKDATVILYVADYKEEEVKPTK